MNSLAHVNQEQEVISGTQMIRCLHAAKIKQKTDTCYMAGQINDDIKAQKS